MATRKLVLEELFQTNAHFQEYAPGFDTSDNFKSYNANALGVKKEITDLISLENWNEIVASGDSDELEALRLAVANKVLYKYAIFRVVTDRKNDRGDTYKYELEKMQRQYIDNYHSAMNTLFEIISADGSVYDLSDTYIGKMMDGLRISTVEDFQRNYYIDTSFLYFVRTIPIQRNLLLSKFEGYYTKLDDKERNDLKDKLDMALVHNIVADSLLQFDLIEFPPTMHSYFDDNTLSRSGKDENNRSKEIASKLLQDANNTLSNIDLILADTTLDRGLARNFNREEYKFYGLM